MHKLNEFTHKLLLMKVKPRQGESHSEPVNGFQLLAKCVSSQVNGYDSA